MQIGRRLYFDPSGNLILDTGERSGSVVETSVEQDFIVYTTLTKREPSTVKLKQLEFGQHEDEFSKCSGVRLVNDELIFDYTPDAADELQQNKSTEERISKMEDTIKAQADVINMLLGL